MKKTKRTLAWLLSLALMLSLLPALALPAAATEPTVIDANTTTWSGAMTATSNVTIYNRDITVTDDTTVTVAEGATLRLSDCPVSIAAGMTLTFAGPGKLAVDRNCGETVKGSLKVTGGTVEITGGGSGSGGQHGFPGVKGDLEVTGGAVTVRGGNSYMEEENKGWVYGGHGIDGNVTITGGSLEAFGGDPGQYDNNGEIVYDDGGAAVKGNVDFRGGSLRLHGGNNAPKPTITGTLTNRSGKCLAAFEEEENEVPRAYAVYAPGDEPYNEGLGILDGKTIKADAWATLAREFANAADGATITLTEDVEAPYYSVDSGIPDLEIPAGVTLELAGHSITSTFVLPDDNGIDVYKPSNAAVTLEGDFTITSGSENEAEMCIANGLTAPDGATLTLGENVCLVAFGTVTVGGGTGTLTVEGAGKLTVSDGEWDDDGRGSDAVKGNLTVNMDGGEVTLWGGDGAPDWDLEGNTGGTGGDGVTGNLEVVSGDVMVTGGGGGNGEDSDLTAPGGGGNGGQGGKGVRGSVTVVSGSACITGGAAGDGGAGRDNGGDGGSGGDGVTGAVTVEGGGVTVTGGYGGNGGYGDYYFGGSGGSGGNGSTGGVTISGGTLTLYAGAGGECGPSNGGYNDGSAGNAGASFAGTLTNGTVTNDTGRTLYAVDGDGKLKHEYPADETLSTDAVRAEINGLTLCFSRLVTVTAGEGMALKAGSGAATQDIAPGKAMTDVVYTAAEDRYFPEGYSVDAVNGVSVKRDSASQITVSGTPTADAEITLPASTAMDTVAAPAFSPAAGTVEAGTAVTITCATVGATIYYIANDTEPAAVYTAPVSVTEGVTLRAWAVKENMKRSADATAEYQVAKYAVTVVYGTADMASAAAGATVTITADSVQGSAFDKWTGVDGLTFTSGSASTATASFTMPASAVTVTASFKETSPVEVLHTVTVVNGTLADGSRSGKYTEGATVSISADPAPEGKVFDKWTNISGTFDIDATAAYTSFTMAAADVTVTASYRDIEVEKYLVTVVNGDGGGVFAVGATVTVKAGNAPSGQVFDQWTSGDILLGEGATSETLTFLMPEKNVTVTATYKYDQGSAYDDWGGWSDPVPAVAPVTTPARTEEAQVAFTPVKLEGQLQVVLSPQRFTVNGVELNLGAYNINGTNFISIRDLAAILRGTPAQFNVEYDETMNQVVLTTGQPYAGDVQTDFVDESASAVPSPQSICINGQVIDLTAFNIGGKNYFSVRELAEILGFGVDYDAATNTAIITSK